MREITIGTVEAFTSFPAEVTVEGKPYFLLKEGEGYALLSRRCPHAGDTVELEDGEFVCWMHGWTFEMHTGRCHNVPSARLTSFEAAAKPDGTLVVMLP